MPLYNLLFQATLENVESITVGEGFSLRVKFECDGCRSQSEKPLVFGWDDQVEVPGGKGTARLLAKCKECNRQFNVDIISMPSAFRYTRSGEWTLVATLECRGGATPVAFEVGDGYSVAGPKAVWRDQDLSEDWAEFDEDAGESVSVLSPAAKFEPCAKR
jgi:hypothetical protein